MYKTGVASLEKIVPAYGWIRDYKRGNLPGDLLAAVVLTAVLVPQGMAYALLAGLPPRYGLYASVVPAVVYALFGTSRHLPVGPFAITSLLTFTSVSALAAPGSEQYVSLVLLLALMVGALQLAMGLLRMGFITNFISHPVMSGFISASAVLIMLSQVSNLLGISVPAHGSTLGTVAGIIRNVGDTTPVTLAVGAASVATLITFSKLLPRIPGPLVVVIGSTLAVYSLGLDRRGVDIVGGVPSGLPALSLPALDPDSLRSLLSAALVVAFVGFISSISAAKEIAARDNYKISSNGELRAVGLANISAAFFSGFPVSGSLSRIAVNRRSGAKTQLSQLAATLFVIVTLLFLTPLLYYLPNAALAAIIIVAVYGLIDLKEARRIFEIRHLDGIALLLTFAVTLFVGVEEGVIAGAGFALLVFIRRTAYPEITELGYVPEEDAYLDLRRFPEAETYPETLIVRFEADLYFANISFLEEWLISKVPEKPRLEWVVINCRGINSIDVTAIEGLERLISDYRSRGVEILFAGMKLPVSRRIEKADWGERFGKNLNYRTTRDALHEIGHSPDRQRR